MSQKIYFEKNGKQIGPIELSDLKLNELKPETLIWFQGLSSWKMVKDVPEIRDLLVTIPPPLPSRKQIVNEEKYDLTYPKEEGLTALGFLLFVAPFFLKFIGFLEFPKEDDFYFKLMIIIVSLSCRIGVTFAVISTAKRLNRDYQTWGIFAFFLPSLSLIIIGQMRKFKTNSLNTN